MTDITTPPSSPDPLAEESLLCPVCGYDLRGTAGDRCSECGKAFDRAALLTSGVPWAHRREIGRLRAFFKTVWLVTIDSRTLRFEHSKPQDLRDARKFRWIAAGIMACALVGAFVVFIGRVGFVFLAVQRWLIGPAPGVSPAWLMDVLVPWSAGATIPATLPILLVVLAVCLTGAQQWLFRLRDASDKRQGTSAAIGLYALAPLTLLLPVVLTAAGIFIAAKSLPVRAGACIVAAAALILPIVRIAQWHVRVRHGRLEHGILAAVRLLALWVIGVLVLLGVLTWCVGFLWIVIDSYR